MAAGAVLMAMATTGLLGSARSVVTVQESPIVAAGSRGGSRGLTAEQVYQRDAAGVVSVSASGVSEGPSVAEVLKGEETQRGISTGSGIEVDGDGAILTAWHVVANASTVTIGLEHGVRIAAEVAGKDPSNDLAVLRIPTRGITLHPLPLGNSGSAQVGEPVIAIGDPFGLERTLTAGVVSALKRAITSPSGVTISGVLQTDAPINPGNSGGPLLNAAGEVIGVNSEIETSGAGGGSVGIAFAIPIDTAKPVIRAGVR